MSSTHSTLRLALFTGQDIGYELARYFSGLRDVNLVVYSFDSKHDKINGYRSAIDFCKANQISHRVASTIDEKLVNEVKAFNPDLILSAYYARVFPKSLSEIPRLGCVNVHPSRLPLYRGPFPTAWAIINGDEEIGVTLHYIDDGVDTGDILIQKSFPIEPDETGFELYTRSMKLSTKIIIENFQAIANSTLKPCKQQGFGSYFGKFPTRYPISWNTPRAQLRNHIRAHALPYFPAYSYLQTKCVLVSKVSLIDIDGVRAQDVGVIVKVFDDHKFAVACPDGCLLVEDYLIFPETDKGDIGRFVYPSNQFQDP